jgi:hypothetical protein
MQKANLSSCHDNGECPICYTDYTDKKRISFTNIKPLEECECIHSICKTCFTSAFKDYYLNNEDHKIKCPLCRFNWYELATYHYKILIGKKILILSIEKGRKNIIINYFKNGNKKSITFSLKKGYCRWDLIDELYGFLSSGIIKNYKTLIKFIKFISHKSNDLIIRIINTFDDHKNDISHNLERLMRINDEKDIFDYLREYDNYDYRTDCY